MKKESWLALLLTVATLVAQASHSADQPQQPSDTPDTSQIQKVISISTAKMKEYRPDANEFKLIRVEQHITRGLHIWTATFKPKAMLPEDPSRHEVGAGGEVFVRVDLANNSGTVIYGE